MKVLPVLWALAITSFLVFLFIRQAREHARNAPLRGEIEARACFSTSLDYAKVLRTGGFGRSTRGQWIVIKGPKRLVVGTDAFMVTFFGMEYVFRGSESSIAFSQAPSRAIIRDWIVITTQNGVQKTQVAISKNGRMPEIWQALAGAGAAPGPSTDFGPL